MIEPSVISSELQNFFCEYQEVKNKTRGQIIKQLETFSDECMPVFKKECEKMLSGNERPIKQPELNYLEVLKIQRKEQIYTNFLEWLINPKSKHNLGTKPVQYFLERIVNDKFDLKGIKVKSEEVIPKGRPDLVIRSKEFICFVEIKIGAKEGKKQTENYYKEGEKISTRESKQSYYIYITLDGRPSTYKPEKWKSIKWSDVISKVLFPLYNETRSSIKEILQMMIYNLQKNENPELVDFFDNEKEYKQDLVSYYSKLKQLKKEEQWQS